MVDDVTLAAELVESPRGGEAVDDVTTFLLIGNKGPLLKRLRADVMKLTSSNSGISLYRTFGIPCAIYEILSLSLKQKELLLTFCSVLLFLFLYLRILLTQNTV